MSSDPRHQDDYAIRFEWGAVGARHLANLGDVVIVVDVLSFSTTVSVAMDRGMRVFPTGEASQLPLPEAPVAVRREDMDAAHPYSLSPAALRSAPAVPVLVLPSPNGSALARDMVGRGAVVLAGCPRNAQATAVAAKRAARGTDPAGQRRRPENAVLVVAAGERWPDGSLRPAVEDLWGAGAIIDALLRSGVPETSCSPEALAALAAWRALPDLDTALLSSASGRELVQRGYVDDVRVAAEVDTSALAALYGDGSFAPLEL